MILLSVCKFSKPASPFKISQNSKVYMYITSLLYNENNFLHSPTAEQAENDKVVQSTLEVARMNLMDLKQQLVRIMKTPVNERWDAKLEGGFILGLLFQS